MKPEDFPAMSRPRFGRTRVKRFDNNLHNVAFGAAAPGRPQSKNYVRPGGKLWAHGRGSICALARSYRKTACEFNGLNGWALTPLRATRDDRMNDWL